METLPENLKEQIADTIIASFLKDADIADSMMGLAIELTEPIVNPENQYLFSEVSGMVGYRLAEFFSRPPEKPETLPDRFNIHAAEMVISGHPEFLNGAFIWQTTPQRVAYWQERNSGESPISEADIAQIERWIAIAKSQVH